MPATIEVLSPDAPVNMADEWYEFATADHFWMQWRMRVLDELLRGHDLGNRLMEVGCGSCVARDQLEALLDRQVDGCDLNRGSLEQAGPARGGTFQYDIFDERPEWREAFSTVFLLDTLEHIDEPTPFLQCIGRHTAPGGWMVINVPALGWLHSAYDDIVGHVKRYTRGLLADELSSAGYELVSARYWGLSMIPVLALRKALAATWSREKIVARGIQPSSGAVDGVLRGMMHAERTVTKRPLVGTSLAALAKRV